MNWKDKALDILKESLTPVTIQRKGIAGCQASNKA